MIIKQRLTGETVSYSINDKEHISVDDMIKKCDQKNLKPTFIYYTNSNSEQQHRFRLVYILEKPTNLKVEIKGVYNFLKDAFKDCNIDTSATDISRIFYGGPEIAYESDIFYKITQVNIENLEKVEKKKEKKLLHQENLEDKNLLPQENSENETIQVIKLLLDGTGYLIYRDKLCKIGSNGIPTDISNFVVIIDEKQSYSNGTDCQVRYKVKCLLLDNPDLELPTLIINPENLNSFNFIIGGPWDRYAIMAAGSTMPRKA